MTIRSTSNLIYLALLLWPSGCTGLPEQETEDRRLIRQAEAAVAAKRCDDAVATYREIEKYFPAHAAMAATRIGDIHILAGRRDEAIAAYRQALKRYPKGCGRHGTHDKLAELTADGRIDE